MDGGDTTKAYLARFAAGVPAAIAVITFLTYAVTLSFGFVFDDHVLIVSNDSIRSWRYLPSYFTSHIWSYRYPHLLANYYRPFFLIWLRLNDALFGLHAWGWHLTLVLAHVAVTFLVYRLALRLTREVWVAAVAGILFGIHPVHSEAVADITSAQEPLSTFFMLAAFLAWLRSQEAGHRRAWLALALGGYAGALLSKESGLMLPILIAVFAWMYSEDEVRRRIRSVGLAIAPFLLVTAAYVPVRIWALKGFAHMVTPVPLRTMILTAPSVLLFYLRLLLWPVGLSCYYDTPYVAVPALGGFVIPLAVVLAAVAASIFWNRRTRRTSPQDARMVAFASLWMAIAIVPVLNFRLLPEGEIAHDRYVYLASVGFCVLVGLGLRQAVSRRPRIIRRPAWVIAGSAAAVLFISLVAATQSLYWSDDLSLNARAHQIAPRNVYATVSLGAAAAARGMDSAAAALYQQALEVRPDFWRANVNLGYLYYKQGNYAEAARYFQRAGVSDPTDGDQFLYLGMSLLALHRLPEAEKAIRTALLVRPQGKNYHMGLGLVLEQEGKLAEAKQELETELELDPQDNRARALLAELESKLRSQPRTPTTGRN
jgi:Tfp pilus assembly protein PilF/4-amino-4-deoxy-L-arabinose transferase-like glycosyltransferase